MQMARPGIGSFGAPVPVMSAMVHGSSARHDYLVTLTVPGARRLRRHGTQHARLQRRPALWMGA